MGRYSSVQAFADNNANIRKISYEQVSGSAGSSEPKVKPEKVINAYGSTAGAGSGEFHVYRHAREREYERLQQLDSIEEEKQKEKAFQETIRRNQSIEEEKTTKNRKKRQREKEAKLRKRNLQKVGITNDTTIKTTNDIIDDNEFEEYKPLNGPKLSPSEENTNKGHDEDNSEPKAISPEQQEERKEQQAVK